MRLAGKEKIEIAVVIVIDEGSCARTWDLRRNFRRGSNVGKLAVGVIVCEAASRFLLKPADYLSPKMIKDRVLAINGP